MVVITKEYYLINNNDLNKINSYLEQNDMNRTSLSIELGISDSYLSAILKSQRYLTSNILKKFKKIGIVLERN